MIIKRLIALIHLFSATVTGKYFAKMISEIGKAVHDILVNKIFHHQTCR